MVLGGLGGTGLVPGRSQDRWGVGYFYASPASGLQHLPPPAPRIRNEQAFELFYDLAAAPWLVVGADLQVVAPARATTTAVFSGLRLVVRL